MHTSSTPLTHRHRLDQFIWKAQPAELRLANVALFEVFLSTALNGSLRSFNTWRASVGNRILTKDFLGIGPNKSWGPQLPIFNDFATQWQLWRPTSPARNAIETMLETTRGPLHCLKISRTYRPLMAKNRTFILPTLRNHHLFAGGGGHHLGLPLGVPTFLVWKAVRCIIS